MKVQSETQLVNWPLFDQSGERIGTIVAMRCASERYCPAWLLVRLRGLRRRLRVVPAGSATWQPPGKLAVPYPLQLVAASPEATEGSLCDPDWCTQVAVFYQRRIGTAA